MQRASVVAWGDEEHVAAARERYGRKRALIVDVLERGGLRVPGAAATMYLWLAVPDGETSESFATGCSTMASSSRRARTSAPPARATRGSRCPDRGECARGAAILERVL